MTKKSYQATNEYHVKYRRKYKRFEILFDRERDAKTIAFLESKPSRAVYIKKLIECDMNKKEGEE